MNRMRRRTLLVTALCLGALALPAAGFAQAPLPRGPTWQISAGVTGALLGGAALTFLVPRPNPARLRGGWLFDDAVRSALEQPTGELRAPHALASDVFMTTNIVGPLAAYGLVAAASPQHQTLAQLNRGLIASQAFLANYIATWALKTGFARERPVSAHGNDSFPSGHTSAAFTGAFLLLGPGTPFQGAELSGWRWGLGAAGLAIASTTGILRITAGRHYLTDVLVGAGMGFLFGWVYPALMGNGEPESLVQPQISLLSADPQLSLTFRLPPT